jgi:glutamate-1-semialdehyde 2,1-aminomutase
MMSRNGQELWRKAKQIIPGGSQLLSKRSEQFLPDNWPSYFSKAEGVRVWDLEGNCFVDMSLMGVGACPLGYADPDVNRSVKNAIDKGSMCTLNCTEEVELAEKLIHLHSWAGMVRYTRCGGEAMAVAVRIARAKTGKDIVAFCGYHGWHDWYLAANLSDDRNLDGHLLPGLDPKGVPRGLIGTSLPFQFNDPSTLQEIFKNHGDELAAVIMEPVRDLAPTPQFLKEIHDTVTNTGAVFIVDEVSAGFRMNVGGAHLLYSMKPDIAVFAKAISNGYPMGAIIGTEDVMQSAQDTFISSTYWTERIGPVATLATLQKYVDENVPDHLMAAGLKVQECWVKASEECGIDIEVGGIPPLSHFSFKGENSLACQTLFTQLMLDHGFLAGKSFYASFAHEQSHIEAYRNAVHDSFSIITDAIDHSNITSLLKGPIVSPGFKRLT